jgi:hypothetical protein
LRKLVFIGLTATIVFAIAAVALAQTNATAVVTVTAKVTPSSGGSKSKPINAATDILFEVNADSNSTLAGIDYGIPPSLKISGDGFPKCSADTVNAKGESACPAKSKVGVGTSTALLGPGKAPITFTTGVYTNGKNGLTLALKQDNGAVQVAFDGKIANGHITLSIPGNVQQPVTGLYSYVTSTRAVLGPATGSKIVKKKVKVKGKKKKVTKKVKVKTFLVSRVGCNGGKDTVSVSLPLSPNPNPPAQTPISGTTSTPCSK